ncbi:MBL fold metallo-hydrolase [Nocardioides sp. GY 10127]|uniref:MBL fold metallo-hydrolase n=1 Tax=Nocardioides sp. GY 10127 TaxID=2569762 RepID=UPI0010A7B0D1|nr:MBL fold metallo-hydrolase [Nocardioides sp. GY 10127]TIC86569.1 MBL fold metallo-hydrolase [Nocardioides sp. GY 10127]
MSETYTGQVRVGGAPDTREVGDLRITKVAVDERMSNNAYLLTCLSSGDQVLVDAAAEPDTLLALLDPARLRTVVTTHQHWDHHRALADVVAATSAEVAVGDPDADAVTEQTGVPVTRRVQDGDVVPVGSCGLEVVRITGHTPGAVVLAFTEPGGRAHLFTGDSLFPGGPGKTPDAEAFASIMDDLERKVFDRFGDDTWFYPGHGDDSTLGAERPQLAEWRARGW